MSARVLNFTNSIWNTLSGVAHRGASRRLFWLTLVVALMSGGFSTASAQITTIPNSRRGPQPPPMSGIPTTSVRTSSPFQERRIRQLNVERQKEMVSDAEKLLQLTAELNAEVAKNHSTSLTPDQMRTLAKIEKLAKSVKEKMSNPVQGTLFQDNFPPPMMAPTIP